jgi:hypothetical protein
VEHIRELVVIADTNGFALQCVYAGLREFGRRNAVPVKFKSRGLARFERHTPGAVWIEVHAQHGMDPTFLCIDLGDSGSAFSMERLERCDVYFKRSFEPEQIARLPAALREKVEPYGLFYEAGESGDATLLRRIVCEIVARRRFGAPISRALFRWWIRLLASSWLDPLASRVLGKQLVVEDRHVARSDAPLGNSVCFQTRMWNPGDAPTANVGALNEGRGTIVRALKSHFGSRFVGGVVPSPYSLQLYPDLITPYSDKRAAYLRLLQHCRVSVVTAGIHRSIPGKLGESIAAGRCIVTDRLAYELPVPLEEGRHYLAFDSPEECTAQCERLLNDDAFAAEMQGHNREYFRRHGALPLTIDRCLRRADQISRTKQPAVLAHS